MHRFLVFIIIIIILNVAHLSAQILRETGTYQSMPLVADSINTSQDFQHTSQPNFDPYIQNSLKQQDLKNLAIRDFNQYLELFPSTWRKDNRIHVRAGRSDETGYLVNGMPLSDPLDNSFMGYLIPEAINEINLMPGTYAARYGLANSGLISTNMRSGSDRYRFSLDVHSDNFAEEGEKFLNTYSYQDRIIVAQGEGPLFWKNLHFYTALEFSEIGDAAKRFSQAFYFPELIDGSWNSYAVLAGRPDTVSLSYPSGFTPDNSRSRWAINSKFDLNLENLNLEFLGLYDQLESYNSRIPMIDALNTRKFFNRSHRFFLQGGITHNLSSDTEYKINVGYFNSETETYDEITGNSWLDWSDTALVSSLTGGTIDFSTNTSIYRPSYRFNGINFYRNGTLTTDYSHSTKNQFSMNGFIRQHLGDVHTVTAGFDYRKYKLRFYQIDPVAGFQLASIDNIENQENYLKYYLANYIENVYGYDLFGTEIEDGPDKAREPSFLSFHLEDNIRSKTSVVSFGLRLDRIFTDDRVLRNPANPRIDTRRAVILESEWQEQEAYWYLSPRIGLAINTGKNTLLRLNYNRLVQPPPLKNSYYASFIYDKHILYGGYFYYWPIGFDLRPIEANLVDISFTKNVSKQFKVSGTVFYKRSSGQIQVDRQLSDPGSDILSSYFRMNNLGVSEIHGLDIHAYVPRFKRFQFLLNYTYTYARGSGSNEISNYLSLYRNWLGLGNSDATSLNPLNFVPDHQIVMDIDFRFGHNDGGPILENLGLNLLINGDSGYPYTTVWVPPGG